MRNKAWAFRSRVLLVVIVTVAFTAITIQFSVQRETEKAMLAAHDAHALHLMNTVALHVESQYRSILFHESATRERRQAQLRDVVSIALGCIGKHYEQYQKGLLSQEAAIGEALSDVARMRYDDGVGYVWVNDMGEPFPRMVMHPTTPELDGTLLDDPKFDCAMGTDKNLFVASVDACRKNGSGYIDYLWPKPTQDGLSEDLPKISYVELFEPWNWVVGSGVYVDDIETETQKRVDAVVRDLEQTLSKIRIAKTGYLFIFTSDKEMLVHPDMGRKSDTRDLLNPRTEHNILDEFMEAAKTPAIPFDYTWDRPEQRGNFRFRKRAYITRFAPLGWYIGASFYNAEMEQPGRELGHRILILSSLVLAVAIGFAVLVSKSLIKPLKELTLAAADIEREGIHCAQIPISGTAETIELGAVLSKMVSSIRESETEREDLIAALETQNAELERFAYSVSHDLKSPLITIKGYIGALTEDLAEGNMEIVEDDARRISNAADKMAALLNDVLELSRIGRVVNPPQDVPLGELANEAVQLVTAQIELRNIHVEISPNLPVVYGDRFRLLEVLQNLIDNAVKYMGDEPRPQIEIGKRRDNNETVFYVRDNGIGIESRYQEKIFRLFDQLDQNVDGTGIGLALVKRIVEVHGGRIWVESEGLGQGSTFCFTLATEDQCPKSDTVENDTTNG